MCIRCVDTWKWVYTVFFCTVLFSNINMIWYEYCEYTVLYCILYNIHIMIQYRVLQYGTVQAAASGRIAICVLYCTMDTVIMIRYCREDGSVDMFAGCMIIWWYYTVLHCTLCTLTVLFGGAGACPMGGRVGSKFASSGHSPGATFQRCMVEKIKGKQGGVGPPTYC